jgi:hypothetical protein
MLRFRPSVFPSATSAVIHHHWVRRRRTGRYPTISQRLGRLVHDTVFVPPLPFRRCWKAFGANLATTLTSVGGRKLVNLQSLTLMGQVFGLTATVHHFAPAAC